MSRLLSPLFLAAALVGACSVSDAGRDGGSPDEDRGPIGKADLVGSCELPNGTLLCDGKGTGNCWCDDLCVDFGDCCEDADSVCEIDDAGDGDDDGCGEVFCTLACEHGFVVDENGCEVCECAGQFCGGIAAIQCPPGEVCVYDGDYPDAGGQCEPAPFCGGIAGIPCPDGLICVDVPGDGCDPPFGADCGGMCVPPPATCTPADCGPAPGAPNIECWDGSIGGPVCDHLEDGSCGWTFVECPEEPSASCEDQCGGPGSDGSCWCDSLCTSFGDCCDDYEAECVDGDDDDDDDDDDDGIVCGDEVCGPGHTCVTHVTQVGLMHACQPVPEECEDDVGDCACMGEQVCTGVFDLCSDNPDGGMFCGCPVC